MGGGKLNSNFLEYLVMRSGHFWQGRFYSRYIYNDTYYYTLIQYIEQNPVEAGIVNEVGEYPYTLGSVIMNKNKPVACANKSKLVEELTYENVQEMIGVTLDDEALKVLDEIKMQKVIASKERKRVGRTKLLESYFEKVKDKIKRNSAIINAIEDGYTQAEVGKYLGLSRSRSAVSKIVKSAYSTPDPKRK